MRFRLIPFGNADRRDAKQTRPDDDPLDGPGRAGEPPTASDHDLNEILGARRASIEADLMAATGGTSLCSISRSAGSVPTAKYLEGRLTAVRELNRTILDPATGDPDNCVSQLLATWRLALDNARQHDRGPDWIAYRAGGVDELIELANRIGRPVPDDSA
jgi:hypothetical protein